MKKFGILLLALLLILSIGLVTACDKDGDIESKAADEVAWDKAIDDTVAALSKNAADYKLTEQTKMTINERDIEQIAITFVNGDKAKKQTSNDDETYTRYLVVENGKIFEYQEREDDKFVKEENEWLTELLPSGTEGIGAVIVQDVNSIESLTNLKGNFNLFEYKSGKYSVKTNKKTEAISKLFGEEFEKIAESGAEVMIHELSVKISKGMMIELNVSVEISMDIDAVIEMNIDQFVYTTMRQSELENEEAVWELIGMSREEYKNLILNNSDEEEVTEMREKIESLLKIEFGQGGTITLPAGDSLIEE